ncbi:MAG: HAMP domain-containing sensor histidine kinase [Pseudomonadota bacterium]
MARSRLAGVTPRRLRRWLGVFFVALALPTGILIYKAYTQLKWEAFHYHQVLAEELAARIDARLIQAVNREEVRSFTDYAFLVVAGDPAAGFLQPSPLAAYPVASGIPGVVGYFQVDSDGRFSTPLVPDAGTDPGVYGVAEPEMAQRLALEQRLHGILVKNRLAHSGREAVLRDHDGTAQRRDRPGPSFGLEAAREFEAPPSLDDRLAPKPEQEESRVVAQATFDRLNRPAPASVQKKKQAAASALGRVEDLKLDYRYQGAPAEPARQRLEQNLALLEKRGARKERSALPETVFAGSDETGETDAAQNEAASAPRIRIFESEIDPFEFSLLDSGHFVLFRKVWRNGRRIIQGAVIEQEPFLQEAVAGALRDTALAQMSDLIVAYEGGVLSAYSGQQGRDYLSSTAELSGAVLYQARMSTPLSDLELIFNVNRLPPGPGARLITWVSLILLVVMVGGFYLMYRLGLGQIRVARQQQDFVSAISHELKTPLTSIRMYGEMLREGWASEDKKHTYYDYIHDESERLSRLISNVLQLARVTRNELRLELKPVAAAQLMDGVRSKVSSAAERAGFDLNIHCVEDAANAVIQVDEDAFTQILINLVDNALKFSRKAEPRLVDIDCRLQGSGHLVFAVRDYGPGVPRGQMKKIFRLFYRSENELTRETVGTGIGLALVRQLAQAMDARVDVANRDPGAEFSVIFPLR